MRLSSVVFIVTYFLFILQIVYYCYFKNQGLERTYIDYTVYCVLTACDQIIQTRLKVIITSDVSG